MREQESRAGEAITVCWTVSVTSLLCCNAAILLAHYLRSLYDESQGLELLKSMLLIAGALVGIVSLLLIPIVYRVRKVPPPRGLVVFGALVAAAPIAALLVRAMR